MCAFFPVFYDLPLGPLQREQNKHFQFNDSNKNNKQTNNKDGTMHKL